MIKGLKRRKKKVLLIVIIILLILMTCLIVYFNHNKYIKSEYEIVLEKELKQVNRLARKAWSEAYSNGKKDENEIKKYIELFLIKEKVNPNDYYMTITSKGVNLVKKHNGMLVEPGYYKSGTNFTILIKNWTSLSNTRGLNVVDGRLSLLRIVDDENKIDIAIDKSVTEIKDRIVEEKLEIGTIVIPDSVKKISTNAFEKTNIDEIVLNAKLTELDGQFKDLTALRKITFTGDVRVIRGKTFSNTNINEVNFIGSVDQLVTIRYVTYFDVPSHDKTCVLYINGILANEITIPKGVTEIKDFALHNYNNITKITIPSTVKFIGISAFVGTSAKEIIYEGTKAMWNEIIKMEEWVFNEIDCTVYCTDGNIVYGKEK